MAEVRIRLLLEFSFKLEPHKLPHTRVNTSDSQVQNSFPPRLVHTEASSAGRSKHPAALENLISNASFIFSLHLDRFIFRGSQRKPSNCNVCYQPFKHSGELSRCCSHPLGLISSNDRSAGMNSRVLWGADNLQGFIPPEHCSRWFHSAVKVPLSPKSPEHFIKARSCFDTFKIFVNVSILRNHALTKSQCTVCKTPTKETTRKQINKQLAWQTRCCLC